MPSPPVAGPGRVAVLVPPSNPTVEPEMHALLTPPYVVHAARLPHLPDLPLEARLQAYRDAVPDALRSFGSIPLRAAVFACTGASYPHGATADAQFCADVSRSAGVPFMTAASAVVAALREHGMPPLTLVSPYPQWLTDQSVKFLADAGADVVEVVVVRGAGYIYDLSGQEVIDAVRAFGPDRRSALLLAGTGMPTIEAVEALSADWPRPVLSSATCSAAWVSSALEGSR